MTKPPTPTVNEIVERGFVPSVEEYDLIAHVLVNAANAAKEQGHAEIRVRLRAILGRLSQVVQAPQGLRPDQIDRYRARAREGLEQRDSAKLAGGIQDLIAATLRTDPDPAEKIAGYLLQLVGDLLSAHRASDFSVLERLEQEIAAARTDWDRDGWPTIGAVFQWLAEVIEIGQSDLAAGREPWAE
jgi:hypothetical protein